MSWLVLAVGALLAGAGAWTLAFPGMAQQLLRWFQSNRLYGPAIALRLVFGLALLFGAQGTRWPAASIALGLLFLLAASLIPLLGEDRIGRILGWWLRQPAAWLQAWSVVVIGLAAFIIWLGL